MIRKSKDPGHLDEYADADWIADSIDRKSTAGGMLKIGSATLRGEKSGMAKPSRYGILQR